MGLFGKKNQQYAYTRGECYIIPRNDDKSMLSVLQWQLGFWQPTRFLFISDTVNAAMHAHTIPAVNNNSTIIMLSKILLP